MGIYRHQRVGVAPGAVGNPPVAIPLRHQFDRVAILKGKTPEPAAHGLAIHGAFHEIGSFGAVDRSDGNPRAPHARQARRHS
ncbi:hypothetical protein D9M69_592830 [compost metagenome]